MSELGLKHFWSEARAAVPSLPEQVPEAWAFGATPDQANELLSLVIARTKTATASALWDMETEGESVPKAGEASVILDGDGEPRAVIITTAVEIVPFAEVSAEHAHAEGEDDRTLRSWREIHEQFWRRSSLSPRGFEFDMPVSANVSESCSRYPSPRVRVSRLRRNPRPAPRAESGIPSW